MATCSPASVEAEFAEGKVDVVVYEHHAREVRLEILDQAADRTTRFVHERGRQRNDRVATTQIDLGDLGGDTPRGSLEGRAGHEGTNHHFSEIVPGALVVGSGVAQTHDEQRLVQSASSVSAVPAAAAASARAAASRAAAVGSSTMTRG